MIIAIKSSIPKDELMSFFLYQFQGFYRKGFFHPNFWIFVFCNHSIKINCNNH
jgi:hypothetical protein